MRYQNILILYKQNYPKALSLGRDVQAWLEKSGRNCQLLESPFSFQEAQICPDLAVAVGGDGTLIGLARKLAFKNIPIFGINLGRLGFLTSAEPNNWQQELEKALHGELPSRSCLALGWQLVKKKSAPISGWAINEVVIGRGALARLVNLDLSVNRHFMGQLRCDGVIVCTPIGSTAYAASAGGPLIHPDIQAACMVTVCSFPLAANPLLIPPSGYFELKVVEPTPESELTIDGQEGFKLAQGDILHIASSPDAVSIFGGESNFLEKLGKRGPF